MQEIQIEKMSLHHYPFNWSIFRWLAGESAATAPIGNLRDYDSNDINYVYNADIKETHLESSGYCDDGGKPGFAAELHY